MLSRHDMIHARALAVQWAPAYWLHLCAGRRLASIISIALICLRASVGAFRSCMNPRFTPLRLRPINLFVG